MSNEENRTQSGLTAMEVDTIGEIMSISMGSASTAASTLLDNKVTITAPVVSVVPMDDFNIDPMEPAIAVEIKYVEGILGSNILILRESDVNTILAQMMPGREPSEIVIDEMSESAMCELMNQMMGSSATVLSAFLGRTINISTPATVSIQKWEDFKQSYFGNKQQVVSTRFSISINDVMESEFISVMDIDLAKEIIDVSLNFEAQQSAAQAQQSAAQAQQSAAQAQASAAQAAQTTAAPAATPFAPPAAEAPIVVKDFAYSDFGGGTPVQEAPANIDLVMNVPVVVTVELGRTKRKIKEILEFGQGTIVELDKQAGSQVDVIVNGQLIAHGDVVVVNDNFSIRITEILKSRDSLML